MLYFIGCFLEYVEVIAETKEPLRGDSMIAYVPFEAAFDGRLTSTAKSLLFYLGALVKSKKRDGVWCWESLNDIAVAMSDTHIHYSAKMIKDARYLLCKCGYLKRESGIYLKEIKKNGKIIEREIHRMSYRVIVRLE